MNGFTKDLTHEQEQYRQAWRHNIPGVRAWHYALIARSSADRGPTPLKDSLLCESDRVVQPGFHTV